jgi:ribose-phosphate pyrophosphokinase
MTQVLFDLAPHTDLGLRLGAQLQAEVGGIESRRFPDGELYQRVITDISAKEVIIVADLYQPDMQLFTLLSLGHTLRELGAEQRTLVSAYLPYMRQDRRFKAGESITSKHFAAHLSQAFDSLITVDPHLHRYASLDEIYSLNGVVLSAQSVITAHLRNMADKLLLIGPDEESEQWVKAIATAADLPFQILLKHRSGDYQVEVSRPQLKPYSDHRPVLIDDIISSGRTMLRTLEHLEQSGLARPLIIGVHGIFAGDAYDLLKQRAEVLTCNSIHHPSNAIDLLPLFVDQLKQS